MAGRSFFIALGPERTPMSNANGTRKYDRILLKLSGESLMGDKDYGIDDKMLNAYAEEIIAVAKGGVQLAIVIGGGNAAVRVRHQPQPPRPVDAQPPLAQPPEPQPRTQQPPAPRLTAPEAPASAAVSWGAKRSSGASFMLA